MLKEKGKQPRGRRAASRVGVDSPNESVFPIVFTEVNLLLGDLRDFADSDFATWIEQLGKMIRENSLGNADRIAVHENINMLAQLSKLFYMLHDMKDVIDDGIFMLDKMENTSAN